MASLKVFIADDHKIVRDGLRSLFLSESNISLVGEAENGRLAVKRCRKLKPDIVIMDISMPELNGIDATRQILLECPTTKIIALSMYSDRRYVNSMLKAGASGYILKSCAFDELIKAVFAVSKDSTYMSPSIANTLIKDYANHLSDNDISPMSLLTQREREVLQLIVEGLPTHQIANKLYVSIKTVSTHRQQVMKKLNIDSIAGLTVFAIQEGIISISPNLS